MNTSKVYNCPFHLRSRQFNRTATHPKLIPLVPAETSSKSIHPYKLGQFNKIATHLEAIPSVPTEISCKSIHPLKNSSVLLYSPE